MWDESQKYLFDVNGYLVIKDVLDPVLLGRLNDSFEASGEHLRELDRSLAMGADKFGAENRRTEFDDPFDWPDSWPLVFSDLVSHPRAVSLMLELIGDGFRYDSLKGMVMTPGTEGFVLHGGAGDPASMCYYRTLGDTIRNGLITIAYALTDVEPGDGGFACLPGSHKANYPLPDDVMNLEAGGEYLRQIPIKAGSAVVFTEALIHGTLPWVSPNDRRTIFVRYAPGAVNFRMNMLPAGYEKLEPRLTPLQRAIFRPAYFVNRESVAEIFNESAKTD
ncbi:phytanoyl-CoA dioxygenase family protein [Streptomyces sp. NPDC020965]|uniref:phytanoyl-CoA dioxygenase family protein n=1 Tax=Streptomyces sp. NPDC020965 TaxID=3365105 RepID=UPI0037B3BDD7